MEEGIEIQRIPEALYKADGAAPRCRLDAGMPARTLAWRKVVGQCQARHSHQEFLKFLRRLDREFPGDRELHLVMDNYGTHKTAEVQSWLKRHRRFVPHFIPTSSSCLNLVERWFEELTQKAVRRGVFFSVPDLVQAIEAFMAVWNSDPKPFIWTAKPEDILRKIERARTKLESIQPGSTQPSRRGKREE